MGAVNTLAWSLQLPARSLPAISTKDGRAKVTTDYVPKPTSKSEVQPASQLEAHRGRSQMLRKRDKHLQEFQSSATNSALFWKKFIALA